MEILEATFYTQKIKLMVGLWVPKSKEALQTLTQDMHGFWIVDILECPHDVRDKYIFPTHVTHANDHLLHVLASQNR